MNIIKRVFFKKSAFKKSEIRNISDGSNLKQLQFFTDFSASIDRRKKTNEIIFIENKFDNAINEFIIYHMDELICYYKKNNKQFIYIPLVLKKLISYQYPEIPMEQLDIEKINGYVQKMYDELYRLTNQQISGNGFCGLITLNTNSNRVDIPEFYPIVRNIKDNTIPLSSFDIYSLPKINNKCGSYTSSVLQFKLSDSWEEWYGSGSEYNADDNFDRESKQLIKEVWQNINQLEKMGISSQVLHRILQLDKPRKLSRLIITSDYKIFLEDYNNIEINMAPLPKAVYFMFLKHPEGILFKYLHDYKEELKSIYEQLSSREDLIKAEKSICDLTNPLSNSINEKCSRIREAFVRHCDDNIAKYYYITGERAMPKMILLDRILVDWK